MPPAGRLAGSVNLSVGVQSSAGPVKVTFVVSGPLAAAAPISVPAQADPIDPTTFTASQTWDSSTVADGTYTLQVTATDASGKIAITERQYRIQNAMPTSPTQLAAVPSAAGVALSWQQPAVAEGKLYRLFRDDADLSQMFGGLAADVRSYVDSLVPVGLHHYRLILVDQADHASQPALVDATAAPASGSAPALIALSVLSPSGDPLVRGGLVSDRVELRAQALPLRSPLRFQFSSDNRSWQEVPATPACTDVCRATWSLTGMSAGHYLVRASTADPAIVSLPASLVFSPVASAAPAPATSAPTAPPSAPTALQATVDGTNVRLDWAAAADPTTIYDVYRAEPGSGLVLAASGLSQPSFTDAGLDSGKTYGYLVASRNSSGPGAFSSPVWQQAGSRRGPNAPVFLSPTPAQSSLFSGDRMPLMVALTADGGIASVNFAVQAAGTGAWSALPDGLPFNLPAAQTPELQPLGASTWASTWNTSGLPAGTYILRVLVTDSLARTAEQTRTVRIDGASSRAPPASLNLQAMPIPTGVRLTWTSTGGTEFQVLRSQLNASGPFEAIGTTTASEFLDRDLIPGISYHYQLLQVGPDRATSAVVQVVPLPPSDEAGQISFDGGSLRISQPDAAESIDIVAQMSAPPLTPGVTQQGLAHLVSSSSLSNGKALPRFHQSATLTLPVAVSTPIQPDLAVYQWDPRAQTWTALATAIDASTRTLTAPVSGPGVFVVGAGTPHQAAIADHSSLKQGAVEVRGQWTRTTRVYRNPDGTMTTQLFGSAVNYRDAQGSWQVIDSRLVPSADGTAWHNANNAFGIDLKQLLAGDYQQIVVNNDVYRFALQGATPRKGQSLDPASVSYAGIFPGVGLTDSVTGSGLNETLVLSDASSPDRYQFTLTPPPGSNLAVVRQPNGSWAFYNNGSLAPIFVLNQAQAWEQAAERGERPLAAGHASMSVVRTTRGYLIDVTIDRAWLHDPSRRFPVFLDPTLTVQTDTMDAYWHWTAPTENGWWDDGRLHIGDSDANIDRGTYQFDISALPAGISITQAQLGLYFDGLCITTTVTCAPNHTIEVHRMTSAWDYGSTTSQLTYDSAVLSSQLVNVAGPHQWYFWNVTGTVQNWYSGSQPNDGLLVMRNPDNVLGVSGPQFANQVYYDGSKTPELILTWTAPPGVTVPGAPTNVTGAPADGQVTVSWTAPTVTGGAPISSYTVTAYDASGQPVTVQSNNGSNEVHVLVCGTCTSVTLWNLWNGYKYQFGVVASNSAGGSAETRSAWVIMPAAIYWGSTTPNQSIYSVGQVVTVSMTVSNYITDTAMSMSNLVSDSPYLGAGGGPMTIDGATCDATSAPSCLFNGTTLTVGSFNLAQASSHTFTFQGVMQGMGSGCQEVPNPLTATNAANVASHTFNWLNICDSGLGLEKWWTYVPFDTGPQSVALVNVADGNLVLQQTDTTSVQAHGQFAYVLRRTYNSQDTGLLPNLLGQFGKGWQLNVDDLSAGGVGASALIVPPPTLETIANPLSVTLIDRDGTRHVFTFKGLGASIGALDLNLYGGTGALLPVTLGISPNRSGDHICVDQNFQAPPGVHLGLWRYIEITPGGSASCQNPQTGSPILLGFAAERPDRIRYEFSADGHMLDMRDGNGVDLRYRYLAQPLGGIGWLPNTALGPLTAIYEARSCNDPFQNPKCRAFRFSYNGLGETDVSDPANRVTRYLFDLDGYLTKVINPDGTKIAYTYCNGVAGLFKQLCSMTDPNGGTTSFGYASAWLGPNQVTSVTDRRGVQTTLSYSTGWPTYDGNFNLSYQNGSAWENQAGEWHGFYGIDGSGRVRERDDGIDGNGNWEERTFTYWDADYWGYGCRRPDAAGDNNPCEIWKPAFNTQSQDQDTKYVFNDEGQLLNEHRVIPNALADEETTYGYHAQYFQDSNAVLTYDDTVQGGGDLVTQGPRGDAHTLFAISDKTQMLSPRGNTPNAAYDYVNAYAADYGYRNYLTTYLVDNNSAYNPNSIPSGTTCSYPSRPTANTGNVCEVDGPAFDGIHPTVTRYTYNTFGERITMTTPKEIAENPHWSYIDLPSPPAIASSSWSACSAAAAPRPP
ncbi:MAG: hypothetical protein AUG49_22635 [Catenulispora sp. 13_1_20CM_3_70_7]|nr:MAG: hypothetical protein AUG49_22635 [Catenulispora sp. 13_1_20CM_3_70_7]